jgi:hypothetical protein
MAGVGSRSFREAENRYDSVMRFLSRFLLSLCALLALSGVAVGSAWAQSAQDPPRLDPPQPPRQNMPREGMMPQRNPASLSDSVRRAQRETGGQILGAERVQFDGREINRVKVMDDRGRVRYMDDDPQRRSNARDRDRGFPPREDAPPRARGDNPRRP